MSPPTNATELSWVLAENATWGDIVFSDPEVLEFDLFHKNYNEFVRLTNTPQQAHYILKADEDTFVRFDRLLPLLLNTQQTHLVWGNPIVLQQTRDFWAPSNYLWSYDVAQHVVNAQPVMKSPTSSEDILLGHMASEYVHYQMKGNGFSTQPHNESCSTFLNDPSNLVIHWVRSCCMLQWGAGHKTFQATARLNDLIPLSPELVIHFGRRMGNCLPSQLASTARFNQKLSIDTFSIAEAKK